MIAPDVHFKPLAISVLSISFMEILTIFDNAFPVVTKLIQLTIGVLTIIYLLKKIRKPK